MRFRRRLPPSSSPLAASSLRDGMLREIALGILVAASSFVFLGAVFEGLFGPSIRLRSSRFALFLVSIAALLDTIWVERNDARARMSRFHSRCCFRSYRHS